MSEASERVGMHRYDDCNDQDRYLNAVTWAEHVSLICCPRAEDAGIRFVDLDRDAVSDLTWQLLEWLAKGEE